MLEIRAGFRGVADSTAYHLDKIEEPAESINTFVCIQNKTIINSIAIKCGDDDGGSITADQNHFRH